MLFNTNKMVVYFLIFSALFSCNQNNYYLDYQVDDLWRLPLIAPYELKNVAGAKPEHFSNDNWHILFKNKVKGDRFFEKGVNVTKINVVDSVIYGYGTKNPCFPFIINLKKSSEKIYVDKQKWENALDSLNIDSKKLYDAFDAFENFKNKNILPWHF
jgi:hypothetical protein